MLTRHDEYRQRETGIPFHFNPRVERTDLLRSAESNWHEDIELQLCLEGEGYIMLDSERFPFCAGDIVAIGSNVIHYTGTDSRIVYDCLITDAAFCRESGLEPAALRFGGCFKSEEVQTIWKALRKTYETMDDPCRIAKLRLECLRLFILLKEKHTVVTPFVPTQNSTLDLAKRAIVYIREHAAEPLTLERIAASLLVDKYTLARLFKRATGESVFDYVIGFRCKQAQALIADGMRVSEAAYRAGFSNMSYFTKTFKKRTGKLPSEFKPKCK